MSLDDNLQKIPPQNLDAESSVLGAILLENEAIKPVLEIVRPEDFYRHSHQKIFRAMIELSERREPVDLITLSDFLKGKNELEAVGGSAYLASLADFTPTAANVSHYARIVRERAILRSLITVATEVATRGYQEPDATEELLSKLKNGTSEIEARLHHNGNGSAVFVKLSDVQTKKLRWLWHSRIPLGKVTVLDGDPGLGKSLLSIEIATCLSTAKPMPNSVKADLSEPAGVVILSAEDDPEDTIKPRLELIGADLDRMVLLSAIKHAGELCLPTVEDLNAIQEAIKAVDAKLVVIDPLMAYLSAETNSYRDQDVRRCLAPLADWPAIWTWLSS